MDYLLPTAVEIPPMELGLEDHPTSLNPLGVKTCGDGGAVSPPAAVANAMADAMLPQVRVTEVRSPLSGS